MITKQGVKTMRQSKRKAAICFVLAGLLLCCAPAFAFTDTEGHPAEADIDRAVRQGWLSCGAGDRFSPDAALTRGVFVTALAKLDGADLPPAGHIFSDVPAGRSCARTVQWAVVNGIASGTESGKFSPDQPVTREQAAVMLIRHANYSGVVLPRRRSRTVQFSDLDACSDSGLDALYTLYRAGIFDAVDGEIRPADVMTRADCAVLLRRYQGVCEGTCPDDQRAMVISHMGYSVEAPENTLEAYELSDSRNYIYVETDVRFTRDNVPVLLHDETIDRTSNGTGKVAQMTYQQLQSFCFDAGKDGYAGTALPTFRQFIQLCAERYLHPYIELKSTVSGKQLEQMSDIVAEYGMAQHVTWISFDYSNLRSICRRYPQAEVGYVRSYADVRTVEQTEQLKTGKNNVYLCAKYTTLTSSVRAQCLRAGIYLEAWTIDERRTAVQQLNTSIQGITVDRLTPADIYR